MMTDEIKRKGQTILKEIGRGILILFITVLAFKFIMWNFWKLEQAAAVTKGIHKAPSAVNVTASTGNTTLFQKGFAYNRKGNYYIINHFDIAPHIENIANGFVKLAVNDQEISSLLLSQFKHFNAFCFNGYCFAFTTEHSGIEDLLRLREWMPFMAGCLFKLAVIDEEAKQVIYRLFEDSERELKYGRARISSLLPLTFKKGKLYEMVFDYKVTGDAKPVILAAPAPFHRESILFYHELDTSMPGSYRKVSILFCPREDWVSPVLYVMGRKKSKKQPGRRFDGVVWVKNISIYQYQKEFPWLNHLNGSRVAYLDFLNKIKDEFIGKEFIISTSKSSL
jgi:hypothetical protein